jgi:hypothetical protein
VKEHPVCAGVIYPVENLNWNQYKCKKCNPTASYFYKEGTKPKGKVSRETILADILKIIPRTELTRRNQQEARWNRASIEAQLKETEETNIKRRGNLGYMSKDWIESLHRRGKKRG